jgi:hypothetical protein
MVRNIWKVELRVSGVPKGCRKVQWSNFLLATSEDDGTEHSRPLIGGLDILTMAKKVLKDRMRSWEKAQVSATPAQLENCGGYMIETVKPFDGRRITFKIT